MISGYPSVENNTTIEVLAVSVLDELKLSLGIERFNSIISITLIEIEKRIETLYQLIKEDDRSLLKITAHGLKGESATLGALFLSDACKKMELMAENGDAWLPT
ncbi:MAG: Hpt domain-containing protein [Methylococcales bacterium]|nr:Hpt domain-containing protein [Methylococcales bacterium]